MIFKKANLTLISKMQAETLTFKIGTFNLYNLALPNIIYHQHLQYSLEEYHLKKNWIVQQLTKMQADIVGFQEVIHPEAFTDVLTATDIYKNYHQILAENEDNHPTVALVSKFPIKKFYILRNFPLEASFQVQNIEIPFKKFSKPIIVAELVLKDSITTTVVVVHLKSKAPIFAKNVDSRDPIEKAKGQGRALILRTAEAIALRIYLVKLLQNTDHPVIVLGDVNDGGLAFTSQIITGDPPGKYQSFAQKRQAWDVLLYSVKEIQEKQSHNSFLYTHIHNGYYENLDHILVSQEWVSRNPRSIGRVKYVTVFNDHLLDETLCDEKLPCWKSDHGQLVATLTVNN